MQTIVFLARQEPGVYVRLFTLARAVGIGRKYLERLIGQLTRAGCVQSWNGRAGGYRLARSARDITLLEVVEAVDGPVEADVPQTVTSADAGIDGQLRIVCYGAAEIVRRNVGPVSVAELAGRRRRSS
jgi:Rrf2 family protein